MGLPHIVSSRIISMTYYGAKELAASFRTVRNNTITIAEDIPEKDYGHRATPETRSVAETLVHIAVAPRLHLQVSFTERRKNMAGFDFFSFFDGIIAEEKKPRSKSQIVDLLRSEGERFAQAIETASDDFLAERVESAPGIQPPSRSRFEMLLGSKEHEMHHRAQLMLIERLLGITPHLTRQMQERMNAMRSAQAAR